MLLYWVVAARVDLPRIVSLGVREVLGELQPLADKGGLTLATAVKQAAGVCIDALVSGGAGRVIQILMGDGINTNSNVGRRILRYFDELAQGKWEYALILLKCASHLANLCVSISLCGGPCKNPVENDSLCANASRFFRHLIPMYADDFAQNMRNWILEKLVLIREASVPDDILRKREAMIQLYTERVLPPALLQVVNRDLGTLNFSHVDDVRKPEVAGRLYDQLYRWCLRSDESPVVTRMFTFAECVFTFLRMKIINVPSHVFKPRCAAPQEQNQTRLDKFVTWYDHPDTGKQLRRAALCLQLTLHATSICSQHNKAGEQGNMPINVIQPFRDALLPGWALLVCALLVRSPPTRRQGPPPSRKGDEIHTDHRSEFRHLSVTRSCLDGALLVRSPPTRHQGPPRLEKVRKSWPIIGLAIGAVILSSSCLCLGWLHLQMPFSGLQVKIQY